MKARLLFALLLGVFALLTIADRFAMLELLLLRAGVPLLFAIAQAIAAIGVGAMLRGSREADPAVDFLIGLPALGTLFFLAGLVTVSAWTIVPLLVLAAIAGAVLILAGWKRGETAATSPSPARIAVLLVFLCGVVTALAPPVAIDEIGGTLAIPRAWALEGRAVELPLLGASYFPLGLESAALAPASLLGAIHGGVASHLLHLFAAIAAAIVIQRRTASWLLTAGIVTTPLLALAAGLSLGDWPLIGLMIVTFAALDRGSDRDDIRTASAATAAGLLTSYLFVPFALVAWIARRRRPHWVALAGVVFFARNLILTGNPLAPLFGDGTASLFGTRPLALADYLFHADSLAESLGASLVTLSFFAAGVVPAAMAILALGLFFLTPSGRMLAPFLVVAAAGTRDALKTRWMTALVALAVLAQTLVVLWVTARGGALGLVTASTSTDAFLRAQRPSYGSIAWLNETLPAESRTLVVGLGETYWFARPVRGGGPADGARISRYLDVPAAEALRERLRGDGITHVAVFTEESGTTLDPAAQKRLAQTLDRYAATVTTRGGVTLFTLR
ncbi:MAG TPA: hypothetical protein VFO89_14940 [Thermoanaerobaculia bacterium]|nr:hypothetical protein [Thermoanaerobaculia bacterium]